MKNWVAEGIASEVNDFTEGYANGKKKIIFLTSEYEKKMLGDEK